MIEPLIIQPFEILLDGRDYTQFSAFSCGRTGKVPAVVGTIDVQYKSRVVACIRRLYVHPDYRRRGLGTQLVSAAVQLATEGACESIGLLVQPGTWLAGAGVFYKRQGFRTVWQDPDGEVIMSRPLEAL